MLDRNVDESPFHLPCFSAIIHGYPEIVLMLLKDNLDPDSPACTEYVEVTQRLSPQNCAMLGI